MNDMGFPMLTETRNGRPLGGARTRAGGSCKAKAVRGKARCRMHGGLSTGPRSVEGRERIAAVQRERWARFRASKVGDRVLAPLVAVTLIHALAGD